MMKKYSELDLMIKYMLDAHDNFSELLEDSESIEMHWTRLLQDALTKYNKDLNENQISELRKSTIRYILNKNYSAYKECLYQKSVDSIRKKMHSCNTADRLMDCLADEIENFEKHLIAIDSVNQKFISDHNSSFTYLIRKLTDEVFKMFLESNLSPCKEIVSQLDNILHNVYTSGTPNILNLTYKEQLNLLNKTIESKRMDIKAILQTVYQKIPAEVISLYQEKLTDYIIDGWIEDNKIKQQINKQNFYNYANYFLERLIKNKIGLFDPNVCSVKCRLRLFEIIYLTMPQTQKINTRINVFEYYLLNNNYIDLLDLNLQKTIEEFLEASLYDERKQEDNSIRYTIIISLLVVMTGLNDKRINQNQEWSYSAINRQWLKDIISTVFQTGCEPIIGSHLEFPEWEFILITEKLIAHKMENLRMEPLNMNQTVFKVNPENANKDNKNISFFNAITKKCSNFFKINKSINLFKLENLSCNRSLHITILISGWLSSKDDMENGWKGALSHMLQEEAYALRWDSSSYQGISDAAKILSFRTSYAKAKETGKTLAELISTQSPFRNLSISLIGFSLGSKVIYSCLKELNKKSHYVHNIILLGGAAKLKNDKWAECKKIVTGRMINAYSTTDYIINYFYSVYVMHKAIGNYPIEVQGIENYDVTDLASGHLSFRDNLEKIIHRVNYSSR